MPEAPEDAAESVCAGGMSDLFEGGEDLFGRQGTTEAVDRKAELVFKGAGQKGGAYVDGVGQAGGDHGPQELGEAVSVLSGKMKSGQHTAQEIIPAWSQPGAKPKKPGECQGGLAVIPAKAQLITVQDIVSCGKEYERQVICLRFLFTEQQGESAGAGVRQGGADGRGKGKPGSIVKRSGQFKIIAPGIRAGEVMRRIPGFKRAWKSKAVSGKVDGIAASYMQCIHIFG